jgi:hypothetical protein
MVEETTGIVGEEQANKDLCRPAAIVTTNTKDCASSSLLEPNVNYSTQARNTV